jgi:DNA-binding winged helix-turn-helix (wHTH) protein/tetratricopeptide (TPR) repeat protein
MLQRVLHFDRFALDLTRGCVRMGDQTIELRPKAFDVLRHLAENAGRLVPKQELYEAVWPNVIVSDDSLVQCIRELRQKLGDTEHRLIKTVSRRGYLLDAKPTAGPKAETPGPQRPAEAHSPEGPQKIANGAGWWREILWRFQVLRLATRRAAAPAGGPSAADVGGSLVSERRSLSNWPVVAALSAVLIFGVAMLWSRQHAASPASVGTMMAAPTIGVLPFTTVSSQDVPRPAAPELEAEVRSELARAHRGFDLIIKSAGNDFGWPLPVKVAGARLGVRYLVVGTTWPDGEVQRANVQLIEVETERQVWSEPFEINRGHNGAVNRLAVRIARLIVIQVRTAESRRPLPANIEAGHYVLQGRALHETERGAKSTREAQALFKKALQLDANSVTALQGFAITKLIQVHNAWIPWEQRASALIEAEEAIERLVKLDPGNASGHHLRASLLRALGQPDRAIASLEHALSLNPNYFAAHAELGRVKIDAGRAHGAIGHIEEAIRLIPPEPNIHVLYFWAGLAALLIADDQTALQWLLKARQANPSFLGSTLLLPVAYLGLGEEEKARAAMAEFLKAAPRFTIAASSRWVPTPNATVAKQRERIRDAWRRLGAPEDEAVTASR